MITSIARRFLTLIPTVVLLAGLCGCVDSIREQITFSDKFREEGIRLMADKDYVRAAGAFGRAVKEDPRDFHSHYYLGVCYDEMKKGQLALQCYKTALGVADPRYEQPFRMRIIDAMGRSIAANDDRDAELNAAEARARANPQSDHLLVLAKAYRYRKDHDLAIKYYNQAVLYDPRNFEVYKDYGLYLLDEVKQTQSAELPLRRAYALNTEDDQVNAALKRIIGVVGPSLRERDDLAKPLLPKGPLPDLTRVFEAKNDTGKPTRGTAAGGTPAVRAPRD